MFIFNIYISLKMINTKAKGNRVQRELINMLTKDGWLVGKVEVGGRFTKDKDLFKLFDLACIHEKYGLMFVQVTCNKAHTHKPFLIFSKKYDFKDISYSQYVKVDRKGWIRFVYEQGDKYVEHFY